MNDVTTQCPACDAPVEIDLQDLTEGDCVVCDQCDEALTVVSVSPLELEVVDVVDDYEDDDLEEEDLDGIDDEEDDDDLEVEDDFEDDEEES